MALKRCGSCKHWHQRDASDPEVGAVMGGHLAGVCQRITDGITGGTEAYPLAAVIAIALQTAARGWSHPPTSGVQPSRLVRHQWSRRCAGPSSSGSADRCDRQEAAVPRAFEGYQTGVRSKRDKSDADKL